MAHKKAGGSASTNRDSNSKRLGVKRYGGESVISGNILVRQKGTHFFPGLGVRMGNDHTIYSMGEGKVRFSLKQGKKIINVE